MKIIYKILLFFFIYNTLILNTNFFYPNSNQKQIKTLINRIYNKIEHVDRIEILIKNPKKCNGSTFYKYIYTLTIFIINDDSYIYKTIEENNIDILINKTDLYISKYSS